MKMLLWVLVGLAVAAAAVFWADRAGIVRLHLPGAPAAASRGGTGGKPRKAEPLVSVAIPSITTNLADPGASDFAQVTMTVEVAGPALAKELNGKMPAAEDAVIADLRQSTAAQLAGAAGISTLRTAVTSSLDQILGSAHAVHAVYFTQFIVQ